MRLLLVTRKRDQKTRKKHNLNVTQKAAELINEKSCFREGLIK